MNREMLQKLFSEDKEIFQGGMLFPAWICKGKKEIENRNSPQRAAVYLDIPIPCAGLLYYEKETCRSFGYGGDAVRVSWAFGDGGEDAKSGNDGLSCYCNPKLRI